jgi:hypothetical protein
VRFTTDVGLSASNVRPSATSASAAGHSFADAAAIATVLSVIAVEIGSSHGPSILLTPHLLASFAAISASAAACNSSYTPVVCLHFAEHAEGGRLSAKGAPPQ